MFRLRMGVSGCLAVMLMANFGNVQAGTLNGSLKKIADRGSILVGYRDMAVPFSYLDERKKPIGYSIELCQHIIDEVKSTVAKPDLTIKYVPVTPQNRVSMMLGKKIDIECGSTTISTDRKTQVDFSVTTFLTSVRMVTRADSGISGVEDLKNKTVVTTTGTTSDRHIKQASESRGLQIKNIYGNDHDQSFAMLQAGTADAFVMDDVLLASFVANAKNPKDFVIVGSPLSFEPYSIMLRKDDPDFKAVVDNALIGLMKSGAFYKIYDKWFVQPIPPSGKSLNLPLGDALKRQIQSVVGFIEKR